MKILNKCKLLSLKCKKEETQRETYIKGAIASWYRYVEWVCSCDGNIKGRVPLNENLLQCIYSFKIYRMGVSNRQAVWHK